MVFICCGFLVIDGGGGVVLVASLATGTDGFSRGQEQRSPVALDRRMIRWRNVRRQGVVEAGIRSSTGDYVEVMGVEEGFGVVCKKREGGTKEWNEGADERRRDGGGMGAGVAVGGSGCGAVRCCAALVLLGGSEVWLFGGMGEGRGAGQGASGVVAVVAVVVGRGGLAVGGRRPEATRVGAAARRDEGGGERPGSSSRRKRRWRGLHEHEQQSSRGAHPFLPPGCSPLGRHERQGKTGADRVDTPSPPLP
ncbi:uncharacterized protein K444DRAFT_417325 [Hyaloscypha bicolor E]|uniref:Uncharacterized protein n=1 Tax=Hyaloscypha bicolor E TaxID=1095630 RepID=A0A2J6T779_9HELO|nr:uncharacterized protein K444DRAFT_417325 [Hyaloscypha bicolor E]PMD58864.1 hypothetical protein K444DRAFT_417325 [Hyaloscypha bicolor E]